MTRQMDNDEQALFQRSVVSLEKLGREVARLREEVSKLAARIEPYEGEPDLRADNSSPARLKTFRDVLDHFEAVRRGLQGTERDVAFIRSRIDQITNDSWSRSDLKPYLKS